MQQGFEADLLQNALAGHQLQNHTHRKSQHGQAAIEQLGAVMKTPTLIPIHNPHVRLQRAGIVEAGLIRAPALPLRFRKAAASQPGFTVAVHRSTPRGLAMGPKPS